MSIQAKMRTNSSRGEPGGKRPSTGERITTGRVESFTTKLQDVVVCAHGWAGKDPTSGFLYAATTKRNETTDRPTILTGTFLRQQFVSLLDSLTSVGTVSEFHFYSHSGLDGPIFADKDSEGQFTRSDVKSFPKLTWALNAHAYFYGCNCGLGRFVKDFAKHQRIPVSGAASFSYFSKRRDGFEPFSGDANELPCYQDAYPGMLNLVMKEYGLTASTPLMMWRYLKTLPEWYKARNEHHPPAPMITVGSNGLPITTEKQPQ